MEKFGQEFGGREIQREGKWNEMNDQELPHFRQVLSALQNELERTEGTKAA